MQEGHENFQYYKKRKIFSDKFFILKYLNQKNKNLSSDWKLNIINEQFPIKKKIKSKIIISSVSINSKKIEKNEFFIGINGKKFDGSRFADEALKRGAKIAVIRKNFGKKSNKKILVKDTLKFFKDTSKIIRQSSKLKSIAITGSSGKTSVKELIGQSFGKLTSVYSKIINNQYGVP